VKLVYELGIGVSQQKIDVCKNYEEVERNLSRIIIAKFGVKM
jgi:hypothetical protein